MTFQEAISSAIETQRARLGITATEFSNRLGITRQYYYQLKGNKALWKLDDLDKVAAALGLKSVWEMIDLAKYEEKIHDAAADEGNASNTLAA